MTNFFLSLKLLSLDPNLFVKNYFLSNIMLFHKSAHIPNIEKLYRKLFLHFQIFKSNPKITHYIICKHQGVGKIFLCVKKNIQQGLRCQTLIRVECEIED